MSDAVSKRFGSIRIRVFRFAVGALILAAAACDQQPSRSGNPETPGSYRGTIVAVGDSLTAGLGVSEENAYPARLEAKLAAHGHPYQVINAGISGETSSGLLSRIHWVLTLKPHIVILETGANDGLRGIDPSVIRKNILEIVRILKGKNVIVVLAGMRMVENLGPDYTAAFAGIYAVIAAEERLIFIPFFLDGVAGRPGYNQNDGIHPNADGYRVITERVYPYVLEAIEKLPAGK